MSGRTGIHADPPEIKDAPPTHPTPRSSSAQAAPRSSTPPLAAVSSTQTAAASRGDRQDHQVHCGSVTVDPSRRQHRHGMTHGEVHRQDSQASFALHAHQGSTYVAPRQYKARLPHPPHNNIPKYHCPPQGGIPQGRYVGESTENNKYEFSADSINHRWHSGKDLELDWSSQGFKPLAEKKLRQGYHPLVEQTLPQGLDSSAERPLYQGFESMAVGSQQSCRPASVRHGRMPPASENLQLHPLSY